MTADFLALLKSRFGIVSSRTETSGVVAVRNKTALRQLETLVTGRATVEPLHADRYPRLVRVTETVSNGEVK